MKPVLRFVLLTMLLTGLSACGNQPKTTSEMTLIQPLSQLEWMEKTAATKAAVVNNNALMSMR